LGAGLDYHVTDTLLRRSKRVIAEIMVWPGSEFLDQTYEHTEDRFRFSVCP